MSKSEPTEFIEKISYMAGPVRLAFHRDISSSAKCLIGVFGSGKTSAGAFDLISRASKRVAATHGAIRSRFAVVRNTYPELRDTTIKTYLDWYPPQTGIGRYKETEKIYVLHFNNRQIEILFKALDDQKDVRDLLSLELTGAHVDEAREIHEDIFKGLMGRRGRFPSLKDTGGVNPFLSEPQVVLTSNYPSEQHWIARHFEEGRPGYAVFHALQDENKQNLRPGYYEDLERDYADRPDLLRTLVRGGYGITVLGKLVYPEFRRDLHVSTSQIAARAGAEIVRGWDNTGLSPACVITCFTSTGQWLVLKEFCGDDIGIQDFAEMVSLWCNQTFGSSQKYRDISDPAGKSQDTSKQSPVIYMRKAGIKPEDGIQTFKVRREAVAGRLTKLLNGQPAILIDPRCVRLKAGFEGGYSYPEIGATGIYRPEPAKNEYSHVHDALQYAATRLFVFEKPKEQPKPRPPAPYYGSQGWMG